MNTPSEPENREHFELVYEFVRAIPSGRVVTYGQVAESVRGVSLSPREVGAAMRYAPAGVPWQRVLGAGGHLPIGKRSPEMKSQQRHLLEMEGVVFLPNNPDRVDMARCQWMPPETAQGSLFEE